ncbi:hypothetical protein [Umezawaea sp.]|uniref:hypothetical protein n=1 Tax=Umezawaea sp. TaxID=1955258 RepID=UPI002ED13D6B
MGAVDVMISPVVPARSVELAGQVPVVDASGSVVGVLGYADLVRAFTSEDHALEWRIEDLLRDRYATANWQVRAVDGLVTISGHFADNAQRWALMALMRLVGGVKGLVLNGTATTGVARIRLG